MVHQYLEQLDLLMLYVKEHQSEKGVTVEYMDAYGKFPCLCVDVGPFCFDMEFRLQEEESRNEIRSRLYFKFVGRYGYAQTRFFAMRRKNIPEGLNVFAKYRRDFHFLPTTVSTWADAMIRTVDFIRDNPGRFLKLCRFSCPFNEDGTHKFKSWTSHASIRVGYKDNTETIQGMKGGARPAGRHVVGSDGSFVAFNPRTYGVWYTVECIAGEMPKRGNEQFESDDERIQMNF